jgi:hypothetical protein
MTRTHLCLFYSLSVFQCISLRGDFSVVVLFSLLVKLVDGCCWPSPNELSLTSFSLSLLEKHMCTCELTNIVFLYLNRFFSIFSSSARWCHWHHSLYAQWEIAGWSFTCYGKSGILNEIQNIFTLTLSVPLPQGVTVLLQLENVSILQCTAF